MCKQVFAREAVKELERLGTKINVSRLSAMTGLHRHDFGDDNAVEDTRLEEGNMIVRILGLWRFGERFQTKNGKPKVLSYTGEDNEFKELVYSVSQALSLGSVLFELERMGAVERTPRGLKLIHGGRLAAGDLTVGFQIVSKDLDSVIRAAEVNLLEDSSKPHLHIHTEYDNIAVEDLPEIEEWIREEGKAFQLKVRQYLAQFDRDITPRSLGEEEDNPESRRFVTVGTFSLSGKFKDFY